MVGLRPWQATEGGHLRGCRPHQFMGSHLSRPILQLGNTRRPLFRAQSTTTRSAVLMGTATEDRETLLSDEISHEFSCARQQCPWLLWEPEQALDVPSGPAGELPGEARLLYFGWRRFRFLRQYKSECHTRPAASRFPASDTSAPAVTVY